MAMQFGHGAIQWLSADAATTTYVVNSLTFQPKAIRFYWLGYKNTADGVTGSGNQYSGIGFATSTSDRRAVGAFNTNGAATSVCATIASNDCIAVTSPTATRNGMLDITAFASDGFTLTVDDAAPQDITIFWEAWGGDDITVAVIGDIAEPSGTGNQDYTATGLTSSGTDQVVMFATVQSTAALNTGLVESSTLSVGFATDASNQIVLGGSSDHGSTAMDTDGWCYTGACIGNIIAAGAATTDARGEFVQYNSNGFRINWATRATTSRRTIFLAIKGGKWKANSTTINGTSLNNTTAVTTSFRPIGISLMGRMTAVQSSTATTANARFSFGTGTSTSDRRSMGMLDEDATASSNAEIDYTIQYDQVLSYPGASATLVTAYDISAVSDTSFTLINDLAGGVTSEWIGYLAFASANITIPVGLGSIVITGNAPTKTVTDSVRAVPLGAATVTGYAPVVAYLSSSTTTDWGIENTPVAVTITGLAPSIPATASNTNIAVPAGTIAITGLIPLATLQFYISPSLATVTITGQAPLAPLQINRSPSFGTVTLTGYAPTSTVTYNVFRSPSLGTVTITGQTPLAPLQINRNPGLGTVTITGRTPLAPLQINRNPSSGTVTITGNAPTLTHQLYRNPSLGTVTITGRVPVAATTRNVFIDVGLGSITITGRVPTATVTYNVFRAVGLGTVTITGQVPGAISGNNKVSQPSFGTITITGNAPTLTHQLFRNPSLGTITITGRIPLAPLQINRNPSFGTVTITGNAPTLTNQLYRNPSFGTIIITGRTPLVPLQINRNPSFGTITITGLAPTAPLQINRNPSLGTITITGRIPLIISDPNIEISPALYAISITGKIPTAPVSTVKPTGLGSIVLTGKIPYSDPNSKRRIVSAYSAGFTTTVPNVNELVRTGRYFSYKGAPINLIGVDGQEFIATASYDYEAGLDMMAQYRVQRHHSWLNCYWQPSGFLHPWVYNTGTNKYDLDTWNTTYWTRLKAMVAYAESKDIMIELAIFEGAYPSSAWWQDTTMRSVWNKNFNINGAFTTNASGHFAPEYFINGGEVSTTSGKTVREYQYALVDKVTSELAQYKNVFYDIMNEPYSWMANFSDSDNIVTTWLHEMGAYIRTKTNKIVTVEADDFDTDYNGHFWDLESTQVLDYHPGNNQTVTTIADRLHRAQLKGKILISTESGQSPNPIEPDQTRLNNDTREAWAWLTANGNFAYYNGGFPWYDGWWRLGTHIKAMRDITDTTKWWLMSAVDGSGTEYDSLVTAGPSATRQVLANPGEDYIVYFWGTKLSTSVSINLAAGSYIYTWYDVDTNTTLNSASIVGGGVKTIAAPSTSLWNGNVGLVLVITTGTSPDFYPAVITGRVPVATVTRNVFRAPSLNNVTLTGQLPDFTNSIRTKPVTRLGAVNFTGRIPLITPNVIRAVGLTAVSLTKYAPTLMKTSSTTVRWGIEPTTHGALITRKTPNVTRGIPKYIFPSVRAVTVTGLAPLVLVGRSLIDVPAGAVTFTGIAFSISGGSLPVTNGTVILTGNAPSLSHNYTIVSSAVALTVTGLAPLAGKTHSAAPNYADLQITGRIPTAVGTNNVIISPIAYQQLIIAGNAPTLSVNSFVYPTAATITITGRIPLATTKVLPVGSVTITGLAPLSVPTLRHYINVGLTNVTFTTERPASIIHPNHVATPAAHPLSVSGLTPTIAVTLRHYIDVSNTTVSITGNAPVATLSNVGSHTAQPDTKELVITGRVPVANTTTHQYISVDKTAVSISGLTPDKAITLHVYRAVGKRSIIITTRVGTVRQNVIVPEEVGAVTITGNEPTVTKTEFRFAFPGVRSLTIDTTQPISGTTDDEVCQPGRYSMQINGFAHRMPLTAIGRISLQDIANMFGGVAPHNLAEYYRGGAYVPDIYRNNRIPSSGTISLLQFYGASLGDPS